MRDALALRFFWVMLLVIGVLTLFAQCCFAQGSRRLMLLRAQVASGCIVQTNPITITLVEGFGNTSNNNTYSSASFTPAAAETLVLLAAMSPAGTETVGDTAGWTWWRAGSTNYNTLASPANRLSAWVTQVPQGTTPGSMQVVVTNTSGTGINMHLFRVSGADTNVAWGTNAIAQTSLNASNATANPQVTMSAPNTSGSNAVLVGFADDINSTADNAAGSGTTEADEDAYNTPATGLASYTRLNVPSSATLFTNIATSRDWGAVALELRAGTNRCAGAGEWTPPSGLVYWFAARKLTGTNDGDRLGTIQDFSGNSYHGWQTTEAQRPYYVANAVNSKPAFRFHEGTNYFSLSNVLSGLTAAELFMVCKVDTDPPGAGAQSGIWALGSDTSDNHFPFTDGNVYDGFGTTARKSTGNPSLSLSSTFRLYNVQSGSSAWTNLVDTAVHFATGVNTVGWETAPILGNSKSTLTYGMDGHIAELLLFNSILSPANRSSVTAEMDTQYNLSY